MARKIVGLISTGDLQSAIGRSRVVEDIVTPRLVASYRATLAPHLSDCGDSAPIGLHWCLAPEIAPAGELGPDGHPARGEFLPAIDLPRRMWAGGELIFRRPLTPGDAVRRRSTITAIEEKSGRTGQLIFLTLQHEIATERGVAVEETQTLVYRESADQNAKPSQAEVEQTAADHTETVLIDPVQLFRYSALTFNGHRIHYDAPYATQTEHYAGLVVHGPLQATYLVNLASKLAGSKPRKFSFRAVSATAGVAKIVMKALCMSATRMDLWIEAPGGTTTMKATAEWQA